MVGNEMPVLFHNLGPDYYKCQPITPDAFGNSQDLARTSYKAIQLYLGWRWAGDGPRGDWSPIFQLKLTSTVWNTGTRRPVSSRVILVGFEMRFREAAR
jgi:hypothetical protein